jgi:hypothetical protein
VPNDVGNKYHDGHDDVGIHRHLEHPGDSVRVLHEAVLVGFLVEEWGWEFGSVGHGQLDVITATASIKRSEPALAVRTAGRFGLGRFFFWKRPFIRFPDLWRCFLWSLSKRIKKRGMREGGVWNGRQGR